MPAAIKSSTESEHHRAGWTLFFALLSLQALLAVGWLVSIASDPKNRRLLGLSTSRMALVAALLLAAAVLGWLAWRSRRPAFRAWLDRLFFERGSGWWALAAFIIVIGSPAVAFFLRYLSGGAYLTLYQRLLPLLAFGFAAALTALVWLATGRGLRQRLAGQKELFQASATALLLLLALWLVMALTGLGLVPDVLPDGWGTPGVPILEGQLWLSICAVGLLLALGSRFHSFGRRITGWKVDALLAGLIWLAASAAWLSQPVQSGYFTPQPRAPNFEYYPYSDAITSDLTAQEILLGLGYNNGAIITRPLYVLGLSILHALAGPGYEGVITLQTLLLAFFPVLLYFLGKTLHSRPAGLLVVALAIVRELNAIAGTPYSGVSNSKLIMSDLPTALGVSLVALLGVLWLRQPRRWGLALVSGGVLGLVALVRLQTLLVAPFLALAALLAVLQNRQGGDRYPNRGWVWLVGIALVALGVTLAVAPWPHRNWRITGRVVFDQPVESNLLAGYYSYSGRVSYPRLPGEDDGEYSSRLMGEVLEFVRADPGYVAKFIAGHTLNNLVDTLLVLPIRRDPVSNPAEVLALKNSFWLLWEGKVSPAGGVVVLLNLAVIAVGLGAAWRRLGWAGLLPLFVLLGYSLSSAISRNSGWRYILPVDWTGYFYFACGAVQVLGWLALIFADPHHLWSSSTGRQPAGAGRVGWGRLAALAGLIFLAGASLPLSEIVVPRRYPELPRDRLVEQLLALDAVRGSGEDLAALQAFVLRADTVITRGRVFYPRFYQPGEGEAGTGWRLYQKMDHPHLSFFLVSHRQDVVVLPLAQAPARFPNAAEAWLVGCAGKYWLEPLLVVLPAEGTLYRRDDSGSPLTCGID